MSRQLYTLKFKSSRLKEFDYNIDISFQEAKDLKEVIGLSDSQLLRSIRDIRKRKINSEKLERLFKIRDYLRLKQERISNKNNEWISDYLKKIQIKIYKTLFIKDYITVVIEHPKHYDYIFKNGLMVNGKLYKRFSCSAGQARDSTVILCCDEIIEELEMRLNNGRDMTQKFAPSKFNAYFGLASSSTYLVSEPKFIVIRDFCNTSTFMSNYVTETDLDLDDLVEQKEVTIEMNRTDGMGLISYKQAEIWSKDLGLDYVPSQFGIRQSFLKGMLCVFPIHEFCEKVNGGKYIVDTIYSDENGEVIKADLRDYDVIITESQFKLWNGYKSIDDYIDNYHKNKLYWGVTKYSPKFDKDILRLNYQFIQTLNLNQESIEKLCEKFVDWVNGVSYDNVTYMLLFLLGVNNNENSISKFLKSSQHYWIKSLILYPELKNDKYICKKIKELIKNKIQKGCMGEIYVDGNFQCLVSDPFGFMQHVCGQDVTGLLKAGEFYSNYWNLKNVSKVDTMRSPLTFVSEHVVTKLRNDEDTNYWYRYCTSGFIINYHGHETVNFSGADFDFDILASTSCKQMIDGVYENEYPMYYIPPKPKAINFTNEDLFISDKFGFGSIIGSITNKSSNAYALLPKLESVYGKNSEEYRTTYSRLIQCCKAQSSQIDKTKIGREVKGIPKVWIKYKKEDNDFYNSILLDKHPYFFKYRYIKCKREYADYVDENDTTCHQRFGKPLSRLLSSKNTNDEEKDFIKNYYKHMPVTLSDSPMNLLCRYIEEIKFDISKKIKVGIEAGIVGNLKNNSAIYSENEYKQVADITKQILKQYQNTKTVEDEDEQTKPEESINIDNITERYNIVNHNIFVIVNCLIDFFYNERPNSNKEFLWNMFGKYMFKNIKRNLNLKSALFPLPSDDGCIEYLGKRYDLKEVDIY